MPCIKSVDETDQLSNLFTHACKCFQGYQNLLSRWCRPIVHIEHPTSLGNCSNHCHLLCTTALKLLNSSKQNLLKNVKETLRRWDSERELSLRRHRTRATSHNRLVHKFRDMVVSECRFTKFSEITHCSAHYTVQGHSRSPILLPIKSSYTTSY